MFASEFLLSTTKEVDGTLVVEVPARLVRDVAVDTADATGAWSVDYAKVHLLFTDTQ